MAYDQALDLGALLAPLPDDPEGVGEDLRTASDPASSYLALKDFRVEARAAEREVASAPDSEVSMLESGVRYWRELIEIGASMLQTRSKDLEIASWMCEGLVRTASFSGLALGLDLLAGLVETYWDAGLYPTEDEDGVETRVAPLAGLLGMGGGASLLQPLKLLPLSDWGPEPVALWTVERAHASLQGSDDAEARDRAQSRKTEQVEQIRQAISRSSRGFMRALNADVAAALANLQRLVAAVDQRTDLGRFGSQVADPLRAILQLLNDNAGHLLSAPGETGSSLDIVSEDDPGPGSVRQAGPVVGGGSLTTRADAYAAILRIADFFDQGEPQSVVGQSLREVVRRAQLSLEDLLTELLPDPDQRMLFLQRAGIKGAPPENANYY